MVQPWPIQHIPMQTVCYGIYRISGWSVTTAVRSCRDGCKWLVKTVAVATVFYIIIPMNINVEHERHPDEHEGHPDEHERHPDESRDLCVIR